MAHPVADPEVIPSLNEFWTRTQNDYRGLMNWIKKSVHSPGLVRTQLWWRDLSKVPALTSGFLWSWGLSHSDLKLFTRGNRLGAIFLHRPMVLGSDIALNWALSLLEKTSQTQSLSDSDRKMVEWLCRQLIHFKKGMTYGNYRKDLVIKFLRSSRIVKSRRNQELQVDPEFFSWLNYAISSQHE